MHILHVTASFNPATGGLAEAIRNIILEYNKVGIKAEIVCLDNPDSSFPSVESSDFNVHALGHLDPFWFFSASLTPWLRQNIDRFDAVIIHGLWLYPSYAVNAEVQNMKTRLPRGSEKGRKVPHLLVFPHGMLDPYFQRTVQRRIKAVRNWIYWKLVERQVISGADALLFTCETELLLARQTFRPYQPKNEINVGYGIVNPPPYSADMTSAFLEKCPPAADRQYLLLLSRIHAKKGIDLLIGAYAAIVEAKPEAKDQLPVLVIAGPGLDSPYGEFILQLVQKHPLVDELIHFPGMLTGDAKWGAVYGCEAFCLPSHQENFGIAVIEALACSKPVLISNQINIWREIMQGESGLISDDSMAGTQLILEEWIHKSKHERLDMARNARKTFEAYFQMNQVIHRLNNVFESIGQP